MGDDHESLSPHWALRIVKEHEHVLGLFIEDVWEAVEEIPHCNNDVVLDTKVDAGFEKSKEQVNVCGTNVRRDAHELAEG
jgi:hypothetical protein